MIGKIQNQTRYWNNQMSKNNKNNSKGRWVTLKNGIRIKIEPEKKEAREGAKKKLNSNNNNNLGPEYKGYKGKKAIDKLMKEKKGYIKGAFHRKDIGDIDLAWGKSGDKEKEYRNGWGLSHIIERRKITNQNINKVLNNLPDLIENGLLKEQKIKKGTKIEKRYNVEHKGYRVIVSSTMFNKSTQSVITAFEITKKNKQATKGRQTNS